MDIISINFEKANTSDKWLVVDEDEKGQHPLKCKICGDTFMFKKGETMFSKWIDHIKSHYVDKHLLEKVWVAKDIVHLNYDSVLILTDFNHHNENKSNSSSNDINSNYRDLTKREINAYRNALYRIRNEESITKSKGR
jgi:hypothetical protein